jgi:hypothetical protein
MYQCSFFLRFLLLVGGDVVFHKKLKWRTLKRHSMWINHQKAWPSSTLPGLCLRGSGLAYRNDDKPPLAQQGCRFPMLFALPRYLEC